MNSERPGVVSPAFAKLMIAQIPIGVVLVLIGTFQPIPKTPARIITIAGVFVAVYALAVWAVIAVLMHKRRKPDGERS